MFDEDFNKILNNKLRTYFDGKIVRKDLTKSIKEGANVPVYVLEFLLGQYCNSDDKEIIEEGVNTVKRILRENFVRPDEAQKVLSKLRERERYTVIDKISVKLDINKDTYLAEFSNLGIRNIEVSQEDVNNYERLLCGGIWCIINLEYIKMNYRYEDEFTNNGNFKSSTDNSKSPIKIEKIKPIQMPYVDINEFKNSREHFTKNEWIDILLRAMGMEATKFSYREKWLLLCRLIPLVENNFNLCELGPRSTGKSHIYKEISPNSILVSGGQTTVANLFYNMSNKSVGLVGMWDCVAFDEVAGITFKDKDGIQIMKDYMASGSFSRGKEEKSATASMVFVGNINQSIDVLIKTSHLFEPFPEVMAYDSAFLDRMHCYIPGWEIPKFRPDYFTNEYSFITDYLAECMKELRKEQFGDVSDKYYKFGNNLNQRDVIAVRKTVSGLTKLIYPNGKFEKDEIEEILKISLEMRRRVKEQLKKIGGMEFYDVNFSYIDNETFEEFYISSPEQGSTNLIPDGVCNPGQVYTVSRGKTDMIGVYRIETQTIQGNGKFEKIGLGNDREAKESINVAYNYLKANYKMISNNLDITQKDLVINYQDLNGIGMTKNLSLSTLIAICSAILNKSTLSNLVVLGEISISGTIVQLEDLANILQVCLDNGAKKILLPTSASINFASVPVDLISAFSLIFYKTPQEAIFKALGVE